jgi:phosphoribosylanthranilate isomerase
MELKLLKTQPCAGDHTAILKICGITRRADAELAARHGATHLGFVFHSASPRAVTPGQARTLHEGLPVVKVGVFVDLEPERVREIMAAAKLDVAQLHGHERAEEFRESAFPLWRAFRSPGQAEFEAAEWSQAELFTFDLGAGEKLGGTGLSGDDVFAAEFAAHHPALLSGGLTPENVTARVRHVFPRGVDVSSGVETAKGIKDEKKLITFLENARIALKETGLHVADPASSIEHRASSIEKSGSGEPLP